MPRTYRKVSECRVSLTMPSAQLAKLDAYCAAQRKQTGNLMERATVIREAIDEMLARYDARAQGAPS
jgi:metal-responsive CopG/Arc/MetJ family transcriptional regulator